MCVHYLLLFYGLLYVKYLQMGWHITCATFLYMYKLCYMPCSSQLTAHRTHSPAYHIDSVQSLHSPSLVLLNVQDPIPKSLLHSFLTSPSWSPPIHIYLYTYTTFSQLDFTEHFWLGDKICCLKNVLIFQVWLLDNASFMRRTFMSVMSCRSNSQDILG